MNARNIDEPDMSIADLETSLCTVVVYAGLVHSLRNNVKLRTPAGFRLYIDGARDQASVPDIPCLDYANFRVDGLPARWESRVLRKRPASSITPQLISSVSTRTRGCAGHALRRAKLLIGRMPNTHMSVAYAINMLVAVAGCIVECP